MEVVQMSKALRAISQADLVMVLAVLSLIVL